VPTAAAHAKLEIAAPKRVLFLCTGNSARSQLAEAVLRHLGGDRYEVFSAGTQPHSSVHPEAFGVLDKYRVPRRGLAPKDLSVFATESFDYVITLCDRALEQCPMRPGADIIHWTFPDPVQETASKQRRAFEDVYHGLSRRIQLFLVINDRNGSSGATSERKERPSRLKAQRPFP
jgi:ArsR family transcriptional regulator